MERHKLEEDTYIEWVKETAPDRHGNKTYEHTGDFDVWAKGRTIEYDVIDMSDKDVLLRVKGYDLLVSIRRFTDPEDEEY